MEFLLKIFNGLSFDNPFELIEFDLNQNPSELFGNLKCIGFASIGCILNFWFRV